MKGSTITCQQCPARQKSVFKNLDDEALNSINESKSCRHYHKGELIFSEGSQPRGLFCMQSGDAKVVQSGGDGREQILHLANTGHIMGYRALLSDDVFSCSAIAHEESDICLIPKAVFTRLTETNSQLNLQLIHLLSAELKNVERKLTNAVQKPVLNRLAQAILGLIGHYGLEADGCTIQTSVKREELANLAGTTRETATRLLYELKAKKIVELIGKKIRIVNLPELRIIAQQS